MADDLDRQCDPTVAEMEEEAIAAKHGAVINAMTAEQQEAVRYWGYNMAENMVCEYAATRDDKGTEFDEDEDWDFADAWDTMLSECE